MATDRAYPLQMQEVLLVLLDALWNQPCIREHYKPYAYMEAYPETHAVFFLQKRPPMAPVKSAFEHDFAKVIENAFDRITVSRESKKRLRADDLFQPTLRVVRVAGDTYGITKSRYAVEIWVTRDSTELVGDFSSDSEAKMWIKNQSSDWLRTMASIRPTASSYARPRRAAIM
jgi:hypothetical protein